MDIFSCKNFDAEKATEYLKEVFGAKKVEKKFLMRGREFSRELEDIKQVVAKKV